MGQKGSVMITLLLATAHRGVTESDMIRLLQGTARLSPKATLLASGFQSRGVLPTGRRHPHGLSQAFMETFTSDSPLLSIAANDQPSPQRFCLFTRKHRNDDDPFVGSLDF
jgi:hypothetical protein